MRLSELIMRLKGIQDSVNFDPFVTVNGDCGGQEPALLTERYLYLDTPDTCWEDLEFLEAAGVNVDVEILHIGGF